MGSEMCIRDRHDPAQDPSIENELTEYIRATDPVSEVMRARTTQLLEIVLFQPE